MIQQFLGQTQTFNLSGNIINLNLREAQLNLLVRHVRLPSLKYIPLYWRYSAQENILQNNQTRILLGSHPGRPWAITGKYQNDQRSHHHTERGERYNH